MRILRRYITKDYMITFGLSVSILTFVMCMGVVIKAVDLISRGVSPTIIFKVFVFNLPYVLMFSIPVSALVAALLLFGRLSMDGEITAMKASGLSTWQVISPIVMTSICLSLICIYLNSFLAPKSHFARRMVLANVGIEEPANLLDEGRFVREFPGLLVYVGNRDKEKLKDIVVYELNGNDVVRNVRAKYGEIRPDSGDRKLVVDLYEVRIDQPDPKDPTNPSKSRYINADHYPVKLDFSKIMRQGELRKKVSDMTLFELTDEIRSIRENSPELNEADLRKEKMVMIVEANERLALSMACFAITLLGIPLGMTSKRKESSVGIGISLALLFVFYFFIILAESLVGHPELRPDFIVWVPVIGFEVLGFILIQRIN